MASFITSLLESAHEYYDPTYQKQKEELKKFVQATGLISTAALIGSVAFAILGISLTASGGFAAVIGAPIIFASLPSGYLCYNANKVSENFNDIVSNPKQYQRLLELDPAFDKYKFKNKLTEGTFCFGWAIDCWLDEMVKSGIMR